MPYATISLPASPSYISDEHRAEPLIYHRSNAALAHLRVFRDLGATLDLPCRAYAVFLARYYGGSMPEALA